MNKFAPKLLASLVPLLLCAAADAAGPLAVEGGWVRALPPAQRMTAAYMTLRNDGSETLEIVAVSAAGAADASLHATRRSADRVRMEAVPTLRVPAGATVVLEPGGLHVMLMGLERMPAAGESLSLCLHTVDSEFCAELPVRREAPVAADTAAHGESAEPMEAETMEEELP